MKINFLTIGFLIVFVLEIFAVYTGNDEMRMVTKPLIIPILAIWLITTTKLKGKFHKNIFIGLIFAWVGDVLLMNADFFIYGLSSFFLCHVFYVRAFILDHKSNPNEHNPYFFIATAVFSVYCGILYFYLQPYLGAMQFAVLAYAIIISIMALLAVNRFRKVNYHSYITILIGALLFLISDSFLAVNKFNGPVPFAGVVVMATYMIAQFLIVTGTNSRKLLVTQTEI